MFGYLSFAFSALKHHVVDRARVYLFAGLGILALIYGLLFAPASSFPRGVLVTVEEDMSASETIAVLQNTGVIESGIWFKTLARITRADRDFHAGRYLFTTPEGPAIILYRLSHGISGIPVVRVTFPEGSTAREMAEELETKLPVFRVWSFLALAAPEEGYLFPDTYDVYGDITPEEMLARLRSNFNEKIKEVDLGERTLEEVVIMASLIEREANTPEDRKLVSGILWNRIEIGMALQVDAVFGYIQGSDTYHPSHEDLEIDSPYNTYLYPGLPPGAISNPGLDALMAAAAPADTEYLYYLTGRDGKMYYAKTFEEHKKNRELYLD